MTQRDEKPADNMGCTCYSSGYDKDCPRHGQRDKKPQSAEVIDQPQESEFGKGLTYCLGLFGHSRSASGASRGEGGID